MLKLDNGVIHIIHDLRTQNLKPRSPLAPLFKGGTGIKVAQFIGGFRGI
jgi:hypothetical protein